MNNPSMVRRYFIIKVRKKERNWQKLFRNALILFWETRTGDWPKPTTIITCCCM